jgi:threonine synthase
MSYQGLIEKYRKFLPVSDKTPVVSLLEGNTPLIRVKNLENFLGMDAEIYLKYEGLNPTGSFKDRGMTMAISKAKEAGAKIVMCASTGNTSASAAAYSARAGLKSVVLIPDGNIALGKLSQALIHGAQVIAVKGNFDDALNLVKEITEKYPVILVNSINPYRIEGQKTGAFEIVDVLGTAPDYQFMPVGNAGNITAYWKGYKEYCKGKQLPKMMGFQAALSAPIVLGHIVEKPETIATAIRIGNPASWKSAELARDESEGKIDLVTDDEILEAYKLVAKTEGVFCEPASSASIAGLIKYNKAGFFKDAKKVKIVCILTGHGLKDPDNAIKVSKKPEIIDADIKTLVKIMGL